MSGYRTIILTATLFLNITPSVHAQEFIFPKNGQSAEQQQQDEYSCHSWAVSQTGVNPTKAPVVVSTTPVQPIKAPTQKSAPPGRSVIGGAAAGALIAEIGDNDVSNGAAKGAAVGIISNRRQARANAMKAAEQQKAAQQSAQQQTEKAQQLSTEQLSNYNKAKNVCLDAKGYSVSN